MIVWKFYDTLVNQLAHFPVILQIVDQNHNPTKIDPWIEIITATYRTVISKLAFIPPTRVLKIFELAMRCQSSMKNVDMTRFSFTCLHSNGNHFNLYKLTLQRSFSLCANLFIANLFSKLEWKFPSRGCCSSLYGVAASEA